MNEGEGIREARERRGWDQAELARYLGVTQQTVSRWELGHVTPRPTHQSALAELFPPGARLICQGQWFDGASPAGRTARTRS